MKEAGIKNVVNLEKNIRLVKQSIIKVEAKLNGHSEPPEEEIKKEYVFDLINVSDSELDSDQLKEKKKQLFLKNAAEGRERAKKIRQQLQQEKEEQDAQLELRRQNNPEQYLQELKDMRSKLMRRREMRKKRREELNDRRSQASKQRMRLIVQQTQTVEDAKGKKDKAKRRKQEDLFGVNDSDFDIYRNISKESDSESEHEQEELLKIEELLFKYDPDYKSVDEPLTIEEYHQLRLGTEAFRAPELLFQPAIFGSDRAGLIESIEWLLKSYPSEQQEKLCQNVHVCGGLAGLSGLAERIRRELIMIRPVGAVINVTTASNPLYSAWQGAREWTVREEDEFHSLLLSKEDFMERGLDNLKEHRFSNIYIITKKS
jgi:actin-related protein 5